MPRVSTFMYSDSARMDVINDQQVLNISNPMLNFKPVFIPSTFSFSVTVGVSGINVYVPSNLRYVFKKVDQEKLIIDTGSVQFPPKDPSTDTEAYLPADHRSILANFDFRNVVFEEEGEYTSQVYWGSEILGEYPIYVKGINGNGK